MEEVQSYIHPSAQARQSPRIELVPEHNGHKFDPKLRIGAGVQMGERVHIGVAEYVRIGKEVLFGSNVLVTDHNHASDDPDISIIKQGLDTAPVTIGPGSWIGDNVAILKGVHIGRHSIVGANAVVTKNVPPYSVVAGVPAKVIKALPKPKTENLLSVVIPVRNGVRYTVQCIESIMAFAPLPYEIIVVDNGSTDSTLDTIKGYDLADKVVHFDTNRGYGAACNAGARAAEGDYICFLNNDTLVNLYTFESMLGPLASLPEVGMIGPMCNYINGYQQMSTGGKDHLEVAEGLKDKLGLVTSVPRISGVCFTIRKSLFHEVGGFDERYGLGNYEDDDLCHKVLDAGHVVGVAMGGFCFHHGSRTFAAEKIDYASTMATNKKLFETKWGETYEAWIDRELAKIQAG